MNTVEPIPTTLVSGYLGAGKSSLINHILRENDGKRITVLVNDFGEIAIDSELIENNNGDTLTLTNGCMCCSMGGALFETIDKVLRAKPKPDHIVIETSGVADPNKIAQIAIAEQEMNYAGCLTLVDAVNFSSQRKQKYIGDTVERQVTKAEVAGITKCDLVSDQQVQTLTAELAELDHSTAVVTVDQGRLPFDFLHELFAKYSKIPAQSPALPPVDHGAVYTTWSYDGSARCCLEDLEQISKPETSGVYRLKGYLTTPDGTRYVVQRAGEDFQAQRDSGVDKQTKLVAIGPSDSFSTKSFEQVWRNIYRLQVTS